MSQFENTLEDDTGGEFDRADRLMAGYLIFTY